MANTFPGPPLQPPDAPTRRWAKRPGDLDLSTLKVVSESPETWATSVPILVFLCLSLLDLSPKYATDRQTDRRQTSNSIIAFSLRLLQGRGHNKRRLTRPPMGSMAAANRDLNLRIYSLCRSTLWFKKKTRQLWRTITTTQFSRF